MGDAGLFGPGSMTWKVNSEGVLLFGGGAATILQVAHPLVAAGVSQHSNYREDPWGRLYRTAAPVREDPGGRLYRTLDTVPRITFGSTETSEAAAADLREVHSRVRGTTAEPGG